ncbi:hypothetical protein D3C76_665420 [compost metagenome]
MGNGRGQQTGFFLRQRGLHRANVLFQQLTRGTWQVLDHRPRDHLGARCQVPLQADQLFFEQGQGFRHADQHPVEQALPLFVGRHEGHAVEGHAIACEVLLQRQVCQVRVAAADHREPAMQAGGQGAEAVVEHQHAAARFQRLSVQLLKQVFIGGVERLQGIVALLRLADQVEFGVGGGQQGHGVWLGANLPVADRTGFDRRTILQGFAQGRRNGCQISPRRAAMAMAPALLAALVLVITLRM